MNTNETTRDTRMPAIPETDGAKVTAEEFAGLVSEKYGEEQSPEAKAFRKLASMLSCEQDGRIGAPRDVTYWAWRNLNADGEPETTLTGARLAMASREIGAPIYESDMDDLDDLATRAEAGEELTDEDHELLSDCLNLAMKWIDVAVRTKSSRNGLKDAGLRVA